MKISGETQTTDKNGDKPAEGGPEPVVIDKMDDNMYEQGETMKSVWGMDYTVTRAYVITNIKDAGINVEDMYLLDEPEKTFDKDGNIIGMDSRERTLAIYEDPEKVPEDREYEILLLDISVTNNGGKGEDYNKDGNEKNDVYLEGYVGIPDGIQKSTNMYKEDQCYIFPNGGTRKGYSNIVMEEGETTQVTYGFLIPKDWEEQELYYVAQVSSEGNTMENYGLMKLDVEKGD
jgi:hypothetical protein